MAQEAAAKKAQEAAAKKFQKESAAALKKVRAVWSGALFPCAFGSSET